MQRRRYSLYLSQQMSERLELMAEAHQFAKSQILEKALMSFLASAGDVPASGVQALQQEKTARAIDRLERDLAITTELMATQVRFFLTVTPPLPASEREAARALGRERFEQVVVEIGRRLKTDRRLVPRPKPPDAALCLYQINHVATYQEHRSQLLDLHPAHRFGAVSIDGQGKQSLSFRQ